LTLVFATQFASEIASIANGGEDAMLRQRLASLSDDERGVLRVALGELI
jgi:hypothetical protein